MRGAAKTVSEAIDSRISVRGFTDQPVDGSAIRRVLEKAARSPSGGNLQPWRLYVLGGSDLEAIKKIMVSRTEELPQGEVPEYCIYPSSLKSPYRDYRYKVGEEMYELLGIAREDKPARLRRLNCNFQFFGAPLALFCYIDRQMGPPQWSDLGMYLHAVMLLLREEGLDSCAQGCWSMYPDTLQKFLEPPEELMLFAGMAIGYMDEGDPVNQLRSCRAPLSEFSTFRGI